MHMTAGSDGKGPLRPALLPHWATLVQPLRRYRKPDAAPVLDWERDFKAEVDKVVALFADKRYAPDALAAARFNDGG